MQYYFKVCHICSDRDHFGSTMDMRTKLMGHTTVDLLVDTSWIDLTRSKMAGCWTLRIGEVIDIGTIIVLVLTCVMIVIVIILIGGMIWDTCWMSLRRKIHLPLLER